MANLPLLHIYPKLPIFSIKKEKLHNILKHTIGTHLWVHLISELKWIFERGAPPKPQSEDIFLFQSFRIAVKILW